MTTQEANYIILDKIKRAVEIHKDWRFHQILQSIGVDANFNQFNEESVETLKYIELTEQSNSNIGSSDEK